MRPTNRRILYAIVDTWLLVSLIQTLIGILKRIL
jgi:hypothetical protein